MSRNMHNPAIVALAVIRMKRTDLVKNLAKKIEVKMQAAGVPGRFAQGASQLPDRREQRKLDQAAGLVPFAVKLHNDLVKQVQALAAAGDGNLNTVVDRLLRAGLSAAAADVPVAQAVGKRVSEEKLAAKEAPAKKAASKKVATKKVAAKNAPATKVAANKVAAKKAPTTKTAARTAR